MKTVLYLFCEFVLCVNTYTSPLSISEEKAIPKRIHQVFFFETSSTLPNEFMKSQQTCQKHHSSYMYTLWNKTMINDLIEKEYPEFKQIYDSYDHWVKRVDAGRYLVLHHYGGWYIDIDIVCKRSVDELSAEARAKNASVVVYKTKPVGFTNAVIGISRQHQYLNDVIVALRHSKRWYFIPYLSTMFTTGESF
ncbi:uncharacterized protein LOC132732508 [Ruditapes philippinarum]|uniref:uncharacterized protein LOC132732508 n=1 Tax=Ruditapes philippinarum TaxID=129788 RepID=UPI00295ACF60|nr:uncharacterized protein LOC132732508 [Ruditapes philippinarum]